MTIYIKNRAIVGCSHCFREETNVGVKVESESTSEGEVEALTDSVGYLWKGRI